jgi:hypothetical protein
VAEDLMGQDVTAIHFLFALDEAIRMNDNYFDVIFHNSIGEPIGSFDGS